MRCSMILDSFTSYAFSLRFVDVCVLLFHCVFRPPRAGSLKGKGVGGSVSSQLLAPELTKNSNSRSGSPAPKKAKKEKYRWSEGGWVFFINNNSLHQKNFCGLSEVCSFSETFKLSDFVDDWQGSKPWQNWRDFPGREAAGKKPARLYPNLDLSQTSQRGEGE